MAEKKKYDIAAYIWPSYTGDEKRARIFWSDGIGEWQTVKNPIIKSAGNNNCEYSWSRKPLWGYVNEADPYVMEMEIEAASDYGVNVFIYDWYWYDRRPFLENCLNDGFLKAKNNDKMKFYIMWANHDATYLWDKRNSRDSDSVVWKGSVDRREFGIVAKRVIEKYFKHPSYYCIDGMPVFMLYDIDNLIRGLGGIEAALSAFEAGVLFVASTGRPMCALEDINALFEKDLPFIVFNGAAVIMGKSKKILFSSSLQFDYVRQIYDFGLSRNVPVIMWIGEKLWVSRDCEEVREYQKISGAEINIINDINDFTEENVSKMLWIDNPDNIRRYQIEMNEYFNKTVNCHLSRPTFLEFVSAEASKGKALREIGKIYGIDKSEMIAVGDSYNDLSMLEYAGLSVAMENAPDDIKAVCKYVALSNNNDGVAAVIDKYILA